MARKTKEDALATRRLLMEAALRVFAQKGVSGATLQEVAHAAGATRGAIYWHFRNKADLFNALMDEAILPFEQLMQRVGLDASQDPVDELLQAMLQTLHRIATEERTRALFEVAILKVEYVDELADVRDRHVQAYASGVRELQRGLQQALLRRGLQTALPVDRAAHALHALMTGLVQSWILAPQRFDLVAVGEAGLRALLAGWGLAAPAGARVGASGALA